jgi:hypothetical protein
VTQFNVQLGTFSSGGTGPVYFDLGVGGPSSLTGPGPQLGTGLWVTP